MFTGIIEEPGVVQAINKNSNKATIVIKAKKVLEDSKIGDSVAVNGVCLTLTGKNRTSFSALASAETLKKTGLGGLKVNDLVNLERALKVTDRLGGHIVTGHVDGVGTILDKKKTGDQFTLTVRGTSLVLPYLISKGSVTVDGVSLTVVDVTGNKFSVVIIPHTADNTTLGKKKRGQIVNLEADVISKYVEKYVKATGRDSVTQLLGGKVVKEG